MCTLAFYFQQFNDYPMIVAANRDEYFTRPSADPQVLIEKPLAFGGKDLLAGGTWLGVNEQGLLAAILNRRVGSGVERAAPRSRGLLCLDALKVKSPAEACALLKSERGSTYQPFNLLFADGKEAYIAYNLGEKIKTIKLDRGLHVVSNTSLYEPSSNKLGHAHALFSQVGKEVEGDLDGSFIHRLFRRTLPIWDRPSFIRRFKEILGNHVLRQEFKDPRDAICVHTASYGTVSSSIIFYDAEERRFHYFHASDAPCRVDYQEFLSIEVR